MDYKEAAAFLGVPVGTLYWFVHQRRVPHIRYSARLVRFERDALEAWRRSHRVEPADAGVAGDRPLECSVSEYPNGGPDIVPLGETGSREGVR